MRTSNESTNHNVLFVRRIYFANGINICIEITAALLTLYFFFSFPERKEYLFFGLFFASQFLGILFQIDYLGVGKTNPWSGNELFMIAYVAVFFFLMGSIFYLRGIYALFKTHPTTFYRFLVGFAILAIVGVPFLPDWGGMFPVLFFPLSCCEILPAYYRAARRGFKGARILFFSILITLALLLAMIKAMIDNDLTSSVTIVSIIYLLPAMGLMAFLAVDFARTSVSLKSRILEVEVLSKRSIAQEIEKKEILEQQKDKLEIEVQQRTAELSNSLKNLKSAQTQLIQSEKMASLGELTAGIAHEIQNPLNFVNNFSEMNKDLLEEMNGEIDRGNLNEAKQIAKSVIENQEKINHHGKRADAIVKGMLQHSRISSGQKELTDINILAGEYLRLAFRGFRAKDKSFNAGFNTDFDESVGKINVIPQDMCRVLLNLINNAFYAVIEKGKLCTNGYEPMVSVSTKRVDDKVEIRISDNGVGISQKNLDKIFQPFFTTKPTGQGTGLGLSLAYDIVTKGHGGELLVETEENEGTTFLIHLPT